MLDRQFIRDIPETARMAIRGKGIDQDAGAMFGLDRSSRDLQHD